MLLHNVEHDKMIYLDRSNQSWTYQSEVAVNDDAHDHKLPLFIMSSYLTLHFGIASKYLSSTSMVSIDHLCRLNVLGFNMPTHVI